MFASWLAELIAALTPSERTHNRWAERDDGKRGGEGDDQKQRDNAATVFESEDGTHTPHP